MSQLEKVERLGLSSADFSAFLRHEGYVSELELRFNPAIVARLVQREEVWQAYEDFAERRARGHAA